VPRRTFATTAALFRIWLQKKTLAWTEHVNIAHRNFHLLPEAMEPGLEVTHMMQVPTGTKLPENGRVQMYPCHSFEFHLVLIAFDPQIGKPQIRRYVIGHDCGTVINPHIVKGITLGGIAHGIGAALLEVRLRRRRPDADAELHGLSVAIVARSSAR
jgi:CO/xanthine dehydrogenase Mo-binding subunit